MRRIRLCAVPAILLATLTTLSCSHLSNPLAKETPELFPIKQNQKMGYINRKGEIVIQPQFARAWFFSEGLAVACIEYDKCGYIDQTGKFAINPQFQEAARFSEGLAAVVVEDRIGYIDKTGKLAINPQFSNSGLNLCAFSESLARVKVGEKIGFIDKAGKIVINPQFEGASPFFDGLAAAEIGNKYGFVDKDGKIVINPQFEDAQPFINGLAAVQVGKQYGYVDKEGKIAINPQFDFAFPFSDEGLALVVLNRKIGFVNKTGKYEINLQFASQLGFINALSEAFAITSDIGRISFSEGLAPAQIGEGKTGYIDKTGKIVINPQFGVALPFYGGMAFVVSEGSPGGEMAWIDKEGKYVWREVKEEVRMVVKRIDEKYGYIDTSGRIVINPQFDAANDFSEGLAAVSVEGKWGYINKTGKIVINPQFDSAGEFTNGRASVYLGGKSGYINTEGKYVQNTNNSPTNNNSSNTPTSNSSSNERTGHLTTDTNLRSEAKKDGASVGIHFRGAKVRVLDQTSYESEGQASTWYKVKVYEYGCSANANLGCGKNSPNDADEGWVNAKLVLLN